MTALADLLWPLVAVYAVWRLARAAERFAPPAPEQFDARDEIPADLVGLALMYPDEWAREDTLKVIRERYADHKDWNKVRVAMGVAQTTETS